MAPTFLFFNKKIFLFEIIFTKIDGEADAAFLEEEAFDEAFDDTLY